MNKRRATRHNGRAGKYGVYNPKHNDRDFDVGNSDHIDMTEYEHDLLWDWQHGSYYVSDKADDKTKSFSQVERAFYLEKYGKHIDAQNARNEKNRHPERNKTVDDVLSDPKTCPEETILQIGNVDNPFDAELLNKVCDEYFKEFDARFGTHVHILDWALHTDEAVPHIHERHVFDAKDSYDDFFPQQKKALEELQISLPKPEEKEGKFNNRKMMFDSICRQMFIDIAKSFGIEIEEEPEWNGRDYLEKNDYIIAKQKDVIESNQIAIENQNEELEEITIKLTDAKTMVEEIVETTYMETVKSVMQSKDDSIRRISTEVIDNKISWLDRPERKADESVRNYAKNRLTEIKNEIMRGAGKIFSLVGEFLMKPSVKKETQARAVKSVMESIAEKKRSIELERASKPQEKKTKKREETR